MKDFRVQDFEPIKDLVEIIKNPVERRARSSIFIDDASIVAVWAILRDGKQSGISAQSHGATIVDAQDVWVVKTGRALHLLLEGPLNLRVTTRRKYLERMLCAPFILHQVDDTEAPAADFFD